MEIASHFRSFDAGDPERQLRLSDWRHASPSASFAGTSRPLPAGEGIERGIHRVGSPPRPLVHLPPLPQGAGLARPARRAAPRHPLRRSPKPPSPRNRPAENGTLGHRAVEDAIRRADRILQLNPADAECVLPLLDDAGPARRARALPRHRAVPRAGPRREPRRPRRAATASRRDEPWLLTVAMMRDDQKLALLSLPRRGAARAGRPALAARSSPAPARRKPRCAPPSRRSPIASPGSACSRRDALAATLPRRRPLRLARHQGGVRHGARSRRRPPVCRWSPAGAAASHRSSRTARPACFRRRATPPLSPTAVRDAARAIRRGARRWARPPCAAPRSEHDIAAAAAVLDRAAPRARRRRRDDAAPRHPPRRDRLERGRADPGPRRPPAQPRRPASIARLAAPAGMARAPCLVEPARAAPWKRARLLGLDPEPEPRLIEMDWGEWEGRTLAELRDELGEAMAENEARGLDFRPPGGESPRDVQARLRPLLADLRDPTVAVTHKGVLRALYALATGWTMQAKPPDKLLDGRAHLFARRADGMPSVEQAQHPARAAPMTARVLFYVQHLLGVGHLRRAEILAAAMAAAGLDVTVALGGMPVAGSAVPRRDASPSCRRRQIAGEDFSALLDADGRPVDDAWKARAPRCPPRPLRAHRPRCRADRALSLRPPAVRFRADAAPRRRTRAEPAAAHRLLGARYPRRLEEAGPRRRDRRRPSARSFDAVLVHGDPALIPFDATFPARRRDRRPDPLHRLRRAAGPRPPHRRGRGEVLVSAGGGAVGAPSSPPPSPRGR